MSRGIGKRQREILSDVEFYAGLGLPYMMIVGNMTRAEYESTRRALAGLCDRGVLVKVPYAFSVLKTRIYCRPEQLDRVTEQLVEEERQRVLSILADHKARVLAKCCVRAGMPENATLRCSS